MIIKKTGNSNGLNLQAERLPHPGPTIEVASRTLPRDQPLGIPTYSLPINKRNSHPSATMASSGTKYHQQKEPIVAPMLGTVTTKAKRSRKHEPTYPLPPRSQFTLTSRPLGNYSIT